MKLVARCLFIFFILLLVWQSLVWGLQLPDYLLPPPTQVFSVLLTQYQVIAQQAVPTLYEILLGFILGIVFGCITGLVTAFFRPAEFWFLPLLIISQAIPTFAIAPLFVLWLGYGLAAKIVTIILMIFFPVASALYDGLRRTDPEWLNLARVMNAKKWRVFLYIRLPSALPDLASGVRIAAVVAPIGAIVGEWVGSSRGLGYLMLNANARLQIDMMFAALVVIIMFALILYFSVDRLLRRLIWWHAA